jgi:hypothetical protein
MFKSRALDEREEKFRHNGVLSRNPAGIGQGTVYFSLI